MYFSPVKDVIVTTTIIHQYDSKILFPSPSKRMYNEKNHYVKRK